MPDAAWESAFVPTTERGHASGAAAGSGAGEDTADRERAGADRQQQAAFVQEVEKADYEEHGCVEEEVARAASGRRGHHRNGSAGRRVLAPCLTPTSYAPSVTRFRAPLLIAVTLLMTTACVASRGAALASRSPDPRISSTPSATPAATKPAPIKPLCPQPMGGTITLRDPASGASLRLTVGEPSWSTTSLSPSYGDSPQRGLYFTARVRMVATGAQPVTIGPVDFYVSQPGRPNTTTNDGNAPYSGASSALDSTAANPGETVRGPLTFDLATRHGLLVYAPAGKVTCGWRF